MKKPNNPAIPTLTATIALLAFAGPAAGQSTLFEDNFNTGNDSLTASSVPGGIAPNSYTSYEIVSSRPDNIYPAVGSGSLALGLNGGTLSGFWEAQAVFSSTPITLESVDDYINLTYTFTDTASLLSGSTTSAIAAGLYDDGGSPPLDEGALNNSGLTTSAFPSGGTAGWQGYVGVLAPSGGNHAIYNRLPQSGSTSANQDLIGNGWTYGFAHPAGVAGTLIGGAAASTVSLAQGSQYTMSLQITLSAPGTLTVAEDLYSGADASGALLASLEDSYSGVTDTSFDGMAIGARNVSSTVANPEMTVTGITVTDDIQPLTLPEPSAYVLGGVVALLAIGCRRLH